MNENLDKTYVAWVLSKKNYTAYKLAKETGISAQRFSNIKQFGSSLTWSKINIIQDRTGLLFQSPEHIAFAIRYEIEHPELFKD